MEEPLGEISISGIGFPLIGGQSHRLRVNLQENVVLAAPAHGKQNPLGVRALWHNAYTPFASLGHTNLA